MRRYAANMFRTGVMLASAGLVLAACTTAELAIDIVKKPQKQQTVESAQ